MTAKRASEEEFNELHSLVTKELTNRVRAGADAPTADLKAAIDWLSKNNVTGVGTPGSPLEALLRGLGEVEVEDVERAIR